MYAQDYYFKYVDASSRLAGTKYVLESVLKALKETNVETIETRVAIGLAETELAEIEKVLNGETA